MLVRRCAFSDSAGGRNCNIYPGSLALIRDFNLYLGRVTEGAPYRIDVKMIILNQTYRYQQICKSGAGRVG